MANRCVLLPGAGLLLAACLLAGCAGRQPPQLNFLVAYTHVDHQSEQGIEPIFDSKGGGRAAFGIDGSLRDEDGGGGLRLGGRLVFSGFREDIGDRIVAGEPLLEIEEFAELGLITPQFVASYRLQRLSADEVGFFLEPGVGLGLTLAFMSFGSDLEFGDYPIGTEIDETETELGPSVNPFLRGGFSNGRILIGVEGGYQWTWLEFDDALGRDPEEWYIGAFIAVQLGS